MSTTNMLIAGFGGQGVLFAGKFIAYKGCRKFYFFIKTSERIFFDIVSEF